MSKPTALVTGGSDRLGKAIALRLAQMGYQLILHYNSSKEKAEKVRQEILEMGVPCEILQINFSQDNDFYTIVQDLTTRHNLTLLVNNASDFLKSNFQNEGASSLRHHFKINFEAPYLLTKAFVKYAKKGLIINVLDTNTEKNTTQHLDYILSKKLLKELTLISAYELAPNFRVNGVAPGLVLGPAGATMNDLMKRAKNIPMKSMGSLEQVQNSVEFLVKNPFLTGQIIYVDGGEHL